MGLTRENTVSEACKLYFLGVENVETFGAFTLPTYPLDYPKGAGGAKNQGKLKKS